MPERELSSAPSLTALYPKAVAGTTVKPLLSQLPLVGGHFGARRELPEDELVLHEVSFDRHHLAAYDRVCGFRLRDVLPPTYPHLFAFPLAMQLMTDSRFPFPVMGLVHIENEVVQRRPIRIDERLSLHVRAADLAPHPRGTQFRIVAEGSVEGEPVWESSSSYLRRERGGDSSSDRDRERGAPPRPTAVWKVPGDIGRRYAEVSGDRNPIHMYSLSAKLLGMPRAIAHGMWLKARSLAALEPLPDAFSVEVRFKLPVLLPASVGFASLGDARREFSLHDARSGKPHLSGSLTPR